MKKIFVFITTVLSASISHAQVIYNNSFDNLGLQTYTTGSSSTKYSQVPGTFTLLNDGLKNNIGSLSNPNRPFHEPGLKTTGWAVVYNPAENDTFLVSTSWLDTTIVAVDRWLITPLISNITGNSVLTWLAKSPDPSYPDGYEVYGTTNTGALSPQSFVIGDRLFALADGSTSGGGEKPSWTRRSVSLGAFAGQSLRFAFRNNSKDMYQLWIDDIQVISVANAYDAGLLSVVPRKYVLVNSPDSVLFGVMNQGAVTINTLNVSYQVGNSSVNTENIIFPNGLSYGQAANVKFSLPYSLSSPGYYQVKTWINSMNGQSDQMKSNDTIIDGLTVQSGSPVKNILLEQFVSANDGEGPDAQDKSVALQSASVIVVNVHDQDSIKENNSVALLSDYKKTLPSGMIDRVYFNDFQSTSIPIPGYPGKINLRKNAVTPVSLSVINKNYNPVSKQLVFTLKADFSGSVKGDYRLNAYLTENFVSGPVTDTTINGYNQLSAFFDVPWSAFYQQGYYSALTGLHVLNYWQYQHQNALVYAFDGAYGSNTIIPQSVNQGQSYQQTFSLTISTPTNGVHKFNPDNLYIVGFAAEYSADKNHRNVLNAVKEKLTANPEAVGLSKAGLLNEGTMLYPNPATGLVYLKTKQGVGPYQIELLDLFGKQVKIITGDQQHSVRAIDVSELSGGVYLFKFTSAQATFTQKLIIQR